MSQPNELDQALDQVENDNANYSANVRKRAQRRQSRPIAPQYPAPVMPAPRPQPAAAPAVAPSADKASANSAQKAAEKATQQAAVPAQAPDFEDEADDGANDAWYQPVVNFFTDDRMRLVLAAVCMVGSFFVAYSLVSYFKNAAHDQSVVLNNSLAEMAANPAAIYNVGGGVGAWISQLLMSDWLGLGAIAFIVYFWILALALFKVRKCKFWSVTFKTLLVAISASIVLGFFCYNTGTVMRWGGNHGHYVNQLVMAYATEFGALMLSVLLILIVIAVYLNEIRTAWNKWKQMRYNAKMRQALAQERARKAQNLDDPTAAEGEASENIAAENSGASDVSGAPENLTAENSGASDVPDASENIDAPLSPENPYAPVADSASQQEAENEAPNEPFFIEIDDEEGAEEHAPIDNVPVIDSAEQAEGRIDQFLNIDDEEEDEQEGKETEQEEQGSENFTVISNEIEAASKPNKIERGQDEREPYDHRAELSRYKFPNVNLLKEHGERKEVDMEEQQANKDRIIKTLLDYKIPISSIEATVGPTVTLYEIVPAEGVRISSIKRLEDDIALSLSALGIRIIAPIPGRGTIGIEVPNAAPQIVSMKSVITSKKFQECKMALPMAMGATISNDIFIADLAKMPHMLVAGATGMGKSVGLNAIIASLLYKKHPSELKFVLVDPKMVEFSLYSKIDRQYLAKLPEEEDAIITDPNKVIQTLNSLCVEMDSRYALLKDAGVRTVEEYNKKFTDRRLNPEKGHFYMPYIVIVVDEFADLIMMAGKEVETPISRIAQKARAVGMHMIIATQRPSTNVITGLIKANFPGRIAFRVAQMVDSKTILDRTGANQLIGKGDMLFSVNGSMERVQCAFMSTEEVEEMTAWIGNQVGYPQAYALPEPLVEGTGGSGEGIPGASMDRDGLFDEAARFVVGRNNGSTSSLQRQYNIGYNRAGRLMDQLEAAGIVGPANGAKPRNILVDSITLESILSQR